MGLRWTATHLEPFSGAFEMSIDRTASRIDTLAVLTGSTIDKSRMYV